MTPPAAVAEVVVDAPPDEAFAIFTDEIGLWWRRDTPYWNDRERGLSVRIEPGVGGRFVEVHDLETGEGFEVGRVTAWEPGRRVAFTWTQVGWPDGAETEVEVTFEDAAGRTLVRLEHRGFEEIPGASVYFDGYAAGWKELLAWFGEHAGPRQRREE